MPTGIGIPLNLPKRGNVIAMWSFENNLNDRSGQGNHATGTGTTNYDTSSGKIGTYINNNSDYMTFAKTLVSGTGDFTFSGWVATGNNGGRTGFFSFANKTAYLEKNTSNNLNYGDGTRTLTGGGISFAGGWVHVGLTRTSGTGQLYIDGSTSGSTGDISTSLTTGGGNLYKGLDAQEGWAYKIDEFIFWNAALTAGEMSTVYGLSSYSNPPISDGFILI